MYLCMSSSRGEVCTYLRPPRMLPRPGPDLNTYVLTAADPSRKLSTPPPTNPARAAILGPDRRTDERAVSHSKHTHAWSCHTA
jgi:hypothetical protein